MQPSKSTPACIVTFVTRTRRRCYYATACVQGENGDWGPFRMPEQVTAQLDAMGAKVAWMWIGPPHNLRVRGEAEDACEPVETAAPEDMGRLMFV